METKEIHSEEVQEILNSPPSGIARWGTMIIWIMFLGVLGVALFIKVPDIVSAPVKISPAEPLPGDTSSRYMVYAELTFDNREKISKGQQVLLKINEYPYQKFGMIKAEVDSISVNHEKKTYLARLKLPGGLTTTYDITLTATLNLSGIADITTTKESILTHLLNNL